MIRRPPRSTLFPTRRSSDLLVGVLREHQARLAGINALRLRGRHRVIGLHPDAGLERSEEHTSELQSRSDLVCRLLLEKKKNTCRRTSTVGIDRARRWKARSH